MKRRSVIAIAGFLAACLLVPGWGTALAEKAPPPLAKPVIGVILPFSPAFATIAREQKNAIDLAVAEAGAPVDIIFKDGGGDGPTSTAAFNELFGGGKTPLAVITCSSWASGAVHPLAAEKGVFHIAIASAAMSRTHPRHSVRFTLDAAQEARQLREYLTRFQRIAVFHMDNDYGTNWAKILKQDLGGRMVISLPYDPENKDFRPALARIGEEKPDALVLLSAGTAAEIARQARETGIDAQLVGTRPIERRELLDKSAFTNGLVYTYPSHSFTHPVIQGYQAAYGAPPTIFGLEAYDAVTTLLAALGEGPTSPGALFSWYAKRVYQGALGEVTFDEQGDAVYPYLYKQIINGRFQIADFQYPLLLEKTRQEILQIFHKMDQDVALAAAELSAAGLTGKEADAILQRLCEKNEHAYDCVSVDARGTIVNVAPVDYAAVIGSSIAGQEQMIRLHATRRPVFSQAIETVEGFVGFDLQHPVLDPKRQFIGSVSILTHPTFFDRIVSGKVANFPVEIFLMQKDGRMVYDLNKEEIGRNVFTDPLFTPYPALLKVAKKMAESPRGSGRYDFLDKKLEKKVAKKLIWDTLVLHGTEFRLALAYLEG